MAIIEICRGWKNSAKSQLNMEKILKMIFSLSSDGHYAILQCNAWLVICTQRLKDGFLIL